MAFRIPGFSKVPEPKTNVYVPPDEVISQFPDTQKNLDFTNPGFSGFNFIPQTFNKMTNLPSARQVISNLNGGPKQS